MRILNIILLITLITVSCQKNSITPTVDCNQSDLNFTGEITNTDCGFNTGMLEVNATGGEPPYSYSLDGGPAQESSIFKNLGAGQYKVKVTDNLGCESESNALIANKNGLSVSANATVADCGVDNGSIMITASNGVEPYQYQLENAAPQSSSEFIVSPGKYKIKVTDDNGCEFVITTMVFSTTSYFLDVQPIIANSCSTTGCHNGSVTSLPNFNDFNIVQANASMIKTRTQSGNMPKTGTLTQAEKDLIACWVDDGALDN